MKIKAFIAIAVIASSLALPAFTVSGLAEEEVICQEWKCRDKRRPEKKEPEEKELKKKELEKEVPDREDLEKEVPQKKDMENRIPEKEELKKKVPEKSKEKGAPEEDLKRKVPEKKEEKWYRKKGYKEFAKDPITVLENRKSEVKKLLKEGRISKERADAIIKRIDTGIAEIKEFFKLSLEEKRVKLIKDCKDYLDNKVERGEMDRAKARMIYEDYSNKIKKWDGTGYPKFFRKDEESGRQ